MPVSSAIRQNYSEECEAAINKHINLELHASYVYLFMAYHFDRDDVALQGFSEYYKKRSQAVRKRAEKLMHYQNLRGGSLVLADVKAPVDNWNNFMDILNETLALEKKINNSLLVIRNLAVQKADPHLKHHITSKFIIEVVDTINEVGKLFTNATRVGNDLGLYQLDKTGL